MADVKHGPTLLSGCLARFAADPPPFDPGKLKRLRTYVQDFVESNFTPIPCDADVTVETWLANNNNYTEARKRELLETWNNSNAQYSGSRSEVKVSLFGKVECYCKYKQPRGINSRSDVAKCHFGRFCKLMEDQVYQMPSFIKHVPQRLRPKYIVDLLGHLPGPYYETDYSHFESHFVPEVMEAVEMVLYEHMLKHYPEVYYDMHKAMCGENRCCSNHFRIDVDGRRMSGEMCTSLGNGFTNLMLANFLATEKGGAIVGVVEGDDGLFVSTVPLTPADFSSVGFTIKMLVHEDLYRTSFCGLVSSRDMSTMADPRKTLLTFGWTHSPLRLAGDKVLMELLRAKALSLAYEHPRCPILHTVAKVMLVHTSGYAPRFDGGWYASTLNEEISRFSSETAELMALGPSQSTRDDFADHYGIPVDVQMSVEAEILAWRGGAFDGPWIRYLYEGDEWNDARDYWQRYVRPGRREPIN